MDIPYHISLPLTSSRVNGLQIEVEQGSILEATCEAIVNAANSQGWMGAVVAWRRALADRKATP